MKLRLAVVIAILTTAVLAAASSAAKPIQATAAFDRLKQMAGEWESKDSAGKKSHLHYEVVSSGSAVVERYVSDSMGADNAMETVYYLDGDRLLLTHYCMAGNQPRMEADAYDASSGELRFRFLDGTNLPPASGHMHSARFHFINADRLSAEWDFHENGRLKQTETEQLTRIK